MGVQGVGANQYNYQNTSTQNKKADETSTAVAEDPKDTYEKSSKTQTKNVTYKPDVAKIKELNMKEKAYVGNLQMLVSSLLNQAGKQQQANGANSFAASQNGLDASKVDSYWDVLVDNGDGSFSFHPDLSTEAQDALIDKAREDIGENGYYGVKQTSGRILDFAKAVAGNNPEKIAEMRKMAEEAFASVKKMFGGVLPEISQKTYEAVMAGFDEMTKGLEVAV